MVGWHALSSMHGWLKSWPSVIVRRRHRPSSRSACSMYGGWCDARACESIIILTGGGWGTHPSFGRLQATRCRCYPPPHPNLRTRSARLTCAFSVPQVQRNRDRHPGKRRHPHPHRRPPLCRHRRRRRRRCRCPCLRAAIATAGICASAPPPSSPPPCGAVCLPALGEGEGECGR